ncbi:Uncharacterised protein [Aggregatibacter aphrophilus]|uniref:Uncharacterized protein n=1 Tax=Aggregatibacter aphrophilus TaxID=732 RepID=A0A336N527_AGGAP|nr:Uncharacterised protein [Aggregatibacter aphrophilus]
MLYVLTQGDIQTESKPNAYESLPLLDKLVAKAPANSIVITDTKTLTPLPLRQQAEIQTTLQAAKFSGHIEQNWAVTSFSAIENIHQNKNIIKRNR